MQPSYAYDWVDLGYCSYAWLQWAKTSHVQASIYNGQRGGDGEDVTLLLPVLFAFHNRVSAAKVRAKGKVQASILQCVNIIKIEWIGTMA